MEFLRILQYAVGFGVVIMFTTAAILVLKRFGGTRLQSGDGDSNQLSQAMEDVQVRLGELDQMTQRMNDLEERVDFTERLLEKQREGQRLGPPDA